MGDVNGVGPEILAKALARHREWMPAPPDTRTAPLVIGDAGVLEAQRPVARAMPPLEAVDDPAHAPAPGAVAVYDAQAPAPAPTPGEVTGEAGRCAVAWLRAAVRLALAGDVAAVVTCPLSKMGIRLAGYEYMGHTDVLQRETGADRVWMCCFSEPRRMRIVHVTAHCPLSMSLGALSADRIAEAVRVSAEALARLELPRRRIAVAGVNPHAGEDGLLGSEESDVIAPAVARCVAEGYDCSGPYPPDTVFRRMMEGEFDLVVAMYHDQGHIPFKLVAMDEGVSVTLGLPIVRTSVDHGTAYDIAGKGVAREASLCEAVRLAERFAGRGGEGS
jgi:4-hydroxythreonine-4-phosphate dehydrogenase